MPGDKRSCRHAPRLNILGPLEAWRDGARAGLGEPKQRVVLGLLALNPDVPVRREALIDAVWDERPPETAARLVQAYVSRLRRVLDPGRPPRDPEGLVVSDGACYRLHVTDDQLDLLVFGQLVARARAAVWDGELGAACDEYEQALSLWRGEPLADLVALGGQPAVAQLSRARTAVVLEYARAASSAGSHERTLPSLWALTDREPLNEKAHALLMIALAGNGEQAVALHLYEDLRQRLDDELGVRPDRELNAAYLRVLRQEIPAVVAGGLSGVGGLAEYPVGEPGRLTDATCPAPQQPPTWFGSSPAGKRSSSR